MMDEEEAMRERLSALADGELSAHECSQVLSYAQTGRGQSDWQAYHVIGDVLRGVAVSPMLDASMLERLRLRIAQEKVPPHADLAPVVRVAPPQAQAANASLWHWKLAAGFASLAAAVALGWTAYASLGGGAEEGARLAVAQPASGTAVQAVAALSAPPAAGGPVMLRDPRLDELLAAHRRYGATTALQMPATFLRNASFEAPPKR